MFTLFITINVFDCFSLILKFCLSESSAFKLTPVVKTYIDCHL